MIHLTDSSIQKIMKCLEIVKDYASLYEIRRCCSRTNEISVKYGYHKLHSAGLTLTITNIGTRHDGDRDDPLNDFCLYSLIEQERPAAKTKSGRLTNMYEFDNLRRFYEESQELGVDLKIPDLKKKRYIVKPEETNMNALVEQALTDTLLKVKSVEALEMSRLTLNRDFLGVLRKFASIFSAATRIHIEKCNIQWNEGELSEFLEIFRTIETLCISGTFKEPIVHDQHLSLVSDKIKVKNEDYNVVCFPGITSKSCVNWLKNGVKQINFDNITIKIPLVIINQLVIDLIKKLDLKIIAKPNKMRSPYVFGVLEYSDEIYRGVVLSQLNRNSEWTINKYVYLNDFCKVRPNIVSSEYYYQFCIDRYYDEIDFPKLLEIVRNLHAKVVAEENVDDEFEEFVSDQCHDIFNKLHDYQLRKKLLTLTQEEENRIDVLFLGADRLEEPDAWREGKLAILDDCEETILMIMEQMEEPLAVEGN